MPEKSQRNPSSQATGRATGPDERRHADGTTPTTDLMALQRKAGNRAVSELLSRASATGQGQTVRPVVARKFWDNVPAKFQTVNHEGAGNSEYEVTSSGYRRYAPVNDMRGGAKEAQGDAAMAPGTTSGSGGTAPAKPGQAVDAYAEAYNYYSQVVFNDPDRNFAYVKGYPSDVNHHDWDAAYAKPKATVKGGVVTLTSLEPTLAAAKPVVAQLKPEEGAVVLDAKVGSTGEFKSPTHVGHEVAQLGKPLPTLDDPTKAAAAAAAVDKKKGATVGKYHAAAKEAKAQQAASKKQPASASSTATSTATNP